jgi:hypothetical protein
MITEDGGMPYVQLYAADRERLSSIADLLEEHRLEFTLLDRWEEFDQNLSRAAVSVLALSVPLPEVVREHLKRFERGTSTRRTVSEWPVVHVALDGAVRQDPLLVPTPSPAISVGEVQALLCDEICREAARAVLRFTWHRIAETSLMRETFREAFVKALQAEVPPSAVTSLASLCGRSVESVRDRWREDLRGRNAPALKRFINVQFLLRCRAEKTARLPWAAVAAQFATSEEHLRYLGHELLGRWPRWADMASWLAFTDGVRRSVDTVFRSGVR